LREAAHHSLLFSCYYSAPFTPRKHCLGYDVHLQPFSECPAILWYLDIIIINITLVHYLTIWRFEIEKREKHF